MTDTQRNTLDDAAEGAPVGSNCEQQKIQFEKDRLRQLLEKYPEEERHLVEQIGGMDVVACGQDLTDEQLQSVRNGYEKATSRLGDSAKNIFVGITIYLGAMDDIGGGQALARENAVILNTNKMGISVGEMEAMLSAKGEYRKGDQSTLVGNDYDASELGFVHELGHILEYRAHGDYDRGLTELNQAESPTEYGSRHPREDYAESWMYYIYGGHLDSSRSEIIEADLTALSARRSA
jgi:hypothetical protein